MLAAPSGAAGAFVARHRTAVVSAVLSLTGIATGMATALAWFQAVSFVDTGALALGAVLAAGVGFWQTRHAGLAILTALTPLPGLLWAAPLCGGSGFGVVPFIAYGFGFALAALYAQRVLGRLLRGAGGEPPWRAAAVALGLMAVFAVLWFAKTTQADGALQAVADTLAASVSVLLLLPLAVTYLDFDETYVAQANRVREKRSLLFEKAGNAAIPRWGFSLTGIALVFLALGWFGSEPLLREGWWRYGVTLILAPAVLGTVCGGWREGLALTLVAAVSCVVALWWARYDMRLPFAAAGALQAAMLAVFIGLTGARSMRRWRNAGDVPEMVRRRVLEDASGAVFAALGTGAVLLPALWHAGAVPLVLAVPAAGLCGALLFPAVVTAAETLIPRRRSVEEVFGKKQRPL